MDPGAVLERFDTLGATNSEPRSMAAAATAILVEALRVDAALVYYVEGDRLRLSSAAGDRSSVPDDGAAWLRLQDVLPPERQLHPQPYELPPGPSVFNRGAERVFLAPVAGEGEVRGLIVLIGGQGHKFEDGDRVLAGLLAAHLASVAGLSRRVSEVEAGERRSHQLFEVVSAASQAPDVRSALQQICSLVADSSAADRCSILLYRPGERRLEPVMSQLARRLQGASRESDDRIGVWLDVDAALRPVVSSTVSDLAEDGSPWRPWIRAHGVKSLAAFPVRVRDRLLGLIAVDAYTQSVLFPVEELQFLEAVAGQIGVLIEKAELQEQLRQQAITDPLTGLFNRRYLEARLDEEISRARRSADRLVILLLDVDRLKKINDSYGHLAGDEILLKTGHTLRATCRVSDVAGRMSGDEFMVILPNTTAETARAFIDRLLQRLSTDTVQFEGEQIEAQVSVGLAEFPTDAEDARGLLAISDRDLYANKPLRPA